MWALIRSRSSSGVTEPKSPGFGGAKTSGTAVFVPSPITSLRFAPVPGSRSKLRVRNGRRPTGTRGRASRVGCAVPPVGRFRRAAAVPVTRTPAPPVPVSRTPLTALTAVTVTGSPASAACSACWSSPTRMLSTLRNDAALNVTVWTGRGPTCTVSVSAAGPGGVMSRANAIRVTEAGRSGVPAYARGTSPSGAKRLPAGTASAVPPSVICWSAAAPVAVSSMHSGVAQKRALAFTLGALARMRSATSPGVAGSGGSNRIVVGAPSRTSRSSSPAWSAYGPGRRLCTRATAVAGRASDRVGSTGSGRSNATCGRSPSRRAPGDGSTSSVAVAAPLS